jgi:BirA family transcriptional regulator, biotin operon repressor / biotin---[acetyl-CoA-carboxylase] ligase
MPRRDEIAEWPERLQGVLDAHPGALKRITVLRETHSTQDAARRLGAEPGDVIVAGRQTAGRGRLGRLWADTGEDGIAVTMVLRRTEEGEHLAIAAAVGTALAAESLLGSPIGIKWPNDIVATDGRKLAGILIEQTGNLALIGVGMNIAQRSWPDDLADRAVSIAELGAEVDRIEALAVMLRELHGSLAMDNARLIEEYITRDVLRGRTASFHTPDGVITGHVLHVDALRGLAVATESGEVWLPAATTSVHEL